MFTLFFKVKCVFYIIILQDKIYYNNDSFLNAQVRLRLAFDILFLYFLKGKIEIGVWDLIPTFVPINFKKETHVLNH
jgi:hypothetical protein